MFDNEKAVMNGTAMLDYKILIKDWKYYQQEKLKKKMEHGIPCSCTFTSGVIPEGTFLVQAAEQHLNVRSTTGLITLTITLQDIEGYNLDGNSIQIILTPPPLPNSVVVTFPTEEMFSLALAEFRNFMREMPLLPAPPSSSASSESD